ncbi:MAG: hypothetical protein M1814_003144 [Vezdaea aestivalis]|nr:MAG: hypothetical protein M1814_003144 [Vezdaea aestivalis]
MHSSIVAFLVPLAGLLSVTLSSPAPQSTSTATANRGDIKADKNLTVTDVSFTFLPSNVTYNINDILTSNSSNVTFDTLYDSFYDSYINFTVADARSGVGSTTCSGSFWNAINNTACAQDHYQFQLQAYFPDYWQLNVSHTVQQFGYSAETATQPKTVVRYSTIWVVGIARPSGFEKEFDLYGNKSTTYKYPSSLTSNYNQIAAPDGWVGDEGV